MSIISRTNANTRRANKAAQAMLTSVSRSRKRTAKAASRAAKERARAAKERARADWRAAEAAREARAEFLRRLRTVGTDALTRLQAAVSDGTVLALLVMFMTGVHMISLCVATWHWTCVVVVECAKFILAIPAAVNAFVETATYGFHFFVETATQAFGEVVWVLVEVLDFLHVEEVFAVLVSVVGLCRGAWCSVYNGLYQRAVDACSAWLLTWLVRRTQLRAADDAVASDEVAVVSPVLAPAAVLLLENGEHALRSLPRPSDVGSDVVSNASTEPVSLRPLVGFAEMRCIDVANIVWVKRDRKQAKSGQDMTTSRTHPGAK